MGSALLRTTNEAYRRFRAGAYPLKRTHYSYIPIPKNGCTSLKHWLLEHNTGCKWPFEYSIQSSWRSIHKVYPSRPHPRVPNGTLPIIVLRNPEERFLSGVKNRVLMHKDINVRNHSSEDLIDYVLQNFTQLMKTSAAFKHHFRQQIDFLPPKALLAKAVFLMLGPQSADFFFNLNPQIDLQRKQASDHQKQVAITPEQKLCIQEIYSEDIKFLSSISLR